MTRNHNFSAGPAVLPESVLLEAREALWDYQGSGIGIMECSHRTKLYEAVVQSARDRIRRLMKLTDDQEVLFLQGGASTQFYMVPANLLRGGRAAYIETGHWAEKAIAEGKRYGTVDVVWSGKSTGFDRVPKPSEWSVQKDTRYLHYTSNNTIYGTQFTEVLDSPVPLICDASSDVMSKPIEGSKFDLYYAGAQKNLGPSGVTVVVIRKSLFEQCDPDLPTMMRYKVHADNESMYNTPNTWGIYFLERVCAWIEGQGGLTSIEAANQRRARALYAEIDRTGFWRGMCERGSRSVMNVTFTSGNADWDTTFHTEATKHGLVGLKGHRIAGGLRASLYNAQTDAAVAALVAEMQEFERTHG